MAGSLQPACGEREMAVDNDEPRPADDCRATGCRGCLREKSGVADLWKRRATSILQDLVEHRGFSLLAVQRLAGG